MANKRKPKSDRARRRNEQRKRQNAARRVQKQNGEVKLRIARETNWLVYYKNRSNISEDQYLAGYTFAMDAEKASAVLPVRTVKAAALEFVGASHYDPTPYQLACKRAVDEAITALGPQLSSVVINVCVYNNPASEWAIAFGNRPKEDGIACLRLALDALHEHYQRPKRRKLQHLGVAQPTAVGI